MSENKIMILLVYVDKIDKSDYYVKKYMKDIVKYDYEGDGIK